MNKQFYTIPSFKIDFFFIIIFFAIILPIMGFSFWPAIGLPGELVLLVFWSGCLWPIIKHCKSRNERIEISDTKIVIYQHKKIVVFDWNEIEKIGFQALVSRRMGVYEANPHLAIKLTASSRIKTGSVIGSKEYGFIKKMETLTDYMRKEDIYDLYVNSRFLGENDKSLLDFLSAKQVFERYIAPLIKTNDQAEYDRIVSEDFKAN